MEDAHSVQLGYTRDPESSYFAVFDGHGGAKFAEYCSTHLHLHLQNNPAFSKTCMWLCICTAHWPFLYLGLCDIWLFAAKGVVVNHVC